MKEKIIQNAVNNLQEFGYPDANKDNIFTDIVYSRFFANMLRDNIHDMEQLTDARSKGVLKVLKEIQSELTPNN